MRINRDIYIILPLSEIIRMYTSGSRILVAIYDIWI